METKIYRPQQSTLSNRTGIADTTQEMHFKLYEGYVKATNELTARIAAILSDGKVDQEEMPAYSELTRRLGFEYNGMVLHEYYFGNMKSRGGDDAPKGSAFREAVERSFPSYEIWRTDFVSVGKMRGVGWAMTLLDPSGGNVAGFVPLLVMDVWEHAYLLDYKPAERPKYIDAFLANVDWSAVERRMKTVHATVAR